MVCTFYRWGNNWGTERLSNQFKFNLGCFFKYFIYLFLEIGEGREKERKRNINVWSSLTWPPLGTWPATQACALTENWTGDPLVHRTALNPLSHTSQGCFFSFFLFLFLFFLVVDASPCNPPISESFCLRLCRPVKSDSFFTGAQPHLLALLYVFCAHLKSRLFCKNSSKLCQFFISLFPQLFWVTSAHTQESLLICGKYVSQNNGEEINHWNLQVAGGLLYNLWKYPLKRQNWGLGLEGAPLKELTALECQI